MKISKAAIVAIAGLALTLPAAAVTTTTETTEQFTVDHNALNTSEGIVETYQALEEVARSVCAPDLRSRVLSQITRSSACRDAAMDGAVADINNPALSAYHAEQKG